MFQSWSIEALGASASLTLGTAFSAIFYQHVSNAAPRHFYSVAIISPLLGLIVYSSIVFVGRFFITNQRNVLSPTLIAAIMKYCIGIGACFAATNILTDFGRSGSRAGVPDVSTVLSLVLMKLVVPVSLIVETTFERRRPTTHKVIGVCIIMVGVVSTALSRHENGSVHEKSALYSYKIFALCLSTVPLSLGFYAVKVTRKRFPDVTGVELWAILCFPEMMFSILLTVATLLIKNDSGSVRSVVEDLWRGMMCVLLGIQPPVETDHSQCRSAAVFSWSGLPFGFALNLAIPVLIKLKGSTSVPLFRALALPLASLIAMTGIDEVVSTAFSWDVVIGVFCCTAGLVVFYLPDANFGYGLIAQEEGNEQNV